MFHLQPRRIRLIALLCCLLSPALGLAQFTSEKASEKKIVEIKAITANPRELAVDVRTPFHVEARTSSDPQWCYPTHHRPWGGDWAFDVWADDVSSCGQPVYLRVSPSTLPLGTVPDKLRAKVINISSHPFACSSQNYWDGGYQQAFEIYATYDGEETALGWVLFAHIDNMVYGFGDWIDNPLDTYIGTAFEGGNTGGCWGSCHLHMEFYNHEDWSCIEDNICQSVPENNIAVWGEGSILGKLGGDMASVGSPPRGPLCNSYNNTEKLPCATWDLDLAGCDAHGVFDPDETDDTQDCGYYFGSETCRPRGTANCAAGMTWECDGSDSETFFCSTWDGDVSGCDQHGIFDPDETDDTQDCGYYLGSDRCSGRGTSNCAAGMGC